METYITNPPYRTKKALAQAVEVDPGGVVLQHVKRRTKAFPLTSATPGSYFIVGPTTTKQRWTAHIILRSGGDRRVT
jgi:hypothetical protein